MNMQQIMKQAQKMQKKLEEAQQEAAQEIVEVSSGGGMVTVKMTGLQELVEIKIEKEIVDPEDVDMLQDLIVAAVNEGFKKSKQLLESRMSAITGGMGLNIPGMI